MKQKDTYTFEEGFARAEALVEAMERGEMPLDETFATYERAAALLKSLNEMLDTGEKKIEILIGGKTTDITSEADA